MLWNGEDVILTIQIRFLDTLYITIYQSRWSSDSLESHEKHKASGLSGVVTEILQAMDVGIQWILELRNDVRNVPDDWKTSVQVSVYKRKGDPMFIAGNKATRAHYEGCWTRNVEWEIKSRSEADLRGPIVVSTAPHGVIWDHYFCHGVDWDP